MNLQFNGDRLKKARIYRGLTVAELADKIGVQRQTISMYEIGKSQPADASVMKKISRELAFPEKYFYEHTSTSISGSIYFRSLLTTNKKYRSEQIIKMEFLSHIFALLHDYIEFPAYTPLSLTEDTSPELAANALREAWNLGQGPIDNLIAVVEQHGILVTSFKTSTDDVDAFSELVENGSSPTFLVAYSNNKTSAARIHFDIAHELGHIYLHEWNEDIEEIPRDDFKRREYEANEFAAAFLLPAETFKRDAQSGPQTIAHYKQLKKKWKVSIAAMIRRSHKLGIITADEYQTLIRIMQRRGQRKEEPLDDVLMTASPSLLKSSVLMLLQEGVFTPKEFMEVLALDYDFSIEPEEIEYLLDLPRGTLTPSKIIEISSLQIKRNM
jgi:Zn-dependent peptidase ImmA (M78 family)/transcriptional regulator with XRE-family HTH domain